MPVTLCNKVDKTFASSCISLGSSTVRLGHPIHLSHPVTNVIYIRAPPIDFQGSVDRSRTFMSGASNTHARLCSKVLYLRQLCRHITSDHHPLSPLLPSALGGGSRVLAQQYSTLFSGRSSYALCILPAVICLHTSAANLSPIIADASSGIW